LERRRNHEQFRKSGGYSQNHARPAKIRASQAFDRQSGVIGVAADCANVDVPGFSDENPMFCFVCGGV